MPRAKTDVFYSSPRIDNQLRYLLVATACPLLPLVAMLLLPDPWRGSLMPFAMIFGSYVLYYGFALILYALSSLWRILRRPPTDLRCPVCCTVERSYRTFFVDRVAPGLMRVHCPECHERWFERR